VVGNAHPAIQFAIRSDLVRSFLEANNVVFTASGDTAKLENTEIASRGAATTRGERVSTGRLRFALGNRRFKDEISAMLGRRVERLRQRLRERFPRCLHSAGPLR